MDPEPLFWVDGEAADSLPLPDRGLDLGDGLFETLLLQRGNVLYEELHLERLRAGLERLGFPDCLPRARACLAQAATACAALEWVAARLTITRGGGPRGYAPPTETTPRILVAATNMTRDCREQLPPARAGWATIRWGSQPLLAGLKHLNRLEQVLAAAEAREAGLDEVLVGDQRGLPVSTSAGNLFVLQHEHLVTPPLSDCGIAGTRRRLVIERWAPAIGIEVEERALSSDELEAAQELFYCNSVQGIRAIGELGARQWQDHTVAQRLHQCMVGELPC